ncbi:MAG: hypothetical protein Sylvanvirus30_4 [Sylvanvirus sp.]|uniref:C2H2-type domain-containing protein n=1 Tax=Sylvanvirus sp. TaxID=2487774 RepID=A0A3G5AIW4_9VIRU|nr:MAG: hypothetical protein Sylvanvirus30_4 [Sylvanvirus sp.]
MLLKECCSGEKKEHKKMNRSNLIWFETSSNACENDKNQDFIPFTPVISVPSGPRCRTCDQLIQCIPFHGQCEIQIDHSSSHSTSYLNDNINKNINRHLNTNHNPIQNPNSLSYWCSSTCFNRFSHLNLFNHHVENHQRVSISSNVSK